MRETQHPSLLTLSSPAMTPRNIRNFWRKVERRGPDECWPWLGAKNSDGYGGFTIDGVMYVASHVALILDGRPRLRSPNDLALHRDRPCPSCSNPAHLRWGSAQECTDTKELADRAPYLRPDWRPSAKLSEDEVRAIRASSDTGRALAKAYGVSTATISLIKNRKIWADLV